MALDDDDDFQSDFEMIEHSILVEYLKADSSRFLSRNIYRLDSKQIIDFLTKQFKRGEFAWLQPHKFKEEYRMTQSSFKKLHSMIKDHDVFKPSHRERNKLYQSLDLNYFSTVHKPTIDHTRTVGTVI